MDAGPAPSLSPDEQRRVLVLARQALGAAVRGQPMPLPPEASLPPALLSARACFVTLMRLGELRGCIGGLAAERPLYREVIQRTAQAALDDYRFTPVTPDELAEVFIEVSVLTAPEPLDYTAPDDLPRRLRPGRDGLILCQGTHRATFLPQVWERLPEPEAFVDYLCEKLGAGRGAWRRQRLEAWVYQVEHFAEVALDFEPGIDSQVSSRPD